MEKNIIISKGEKISEYYYSSQMYFSQIMSLAEGVARLLADKAWKIKCWTWGKPFSIFCGPGFTIVVLIFRNAIW